MIAELAYVILGNWTVGHTIYVNKIRVETGQKILFRLWSEDRVKADIMSKKGLFCGAILEDEDSLGAGHKTPSPKARIKKE